MNYQLLGNSIPHLHCHFVPRCYGDPAPGQPVRPNEVVRHLAAEEYEQLVRDIRAELR